MRLIVEITLFFLYFYFVDLQEGWTPLHIAAQSGRTDIVHLLFAMGADTDVYNKAIHVDNTLSCLVPNLCLTDCYEYEPKNIYLSITTYQKKSDGFEYWMSRMEILL